MIFSPTIQVKEYRILSRLTIILPVQTQYWISLSPFLVDFILDLLLSSHYLEFYTNINFGLVLVIISNITYFICYLIYYLIYYIHPSLIYLSPSKRSASELVDIYYLHNYIRVEIDRVASTARIITNKRSCLNLDIDLGGN